MNENKNLHAEQKDPSLVQQDTLFQVSTVPALSSGVYESDINFHTLALHGDTGLGTFNGVDGEMVACDGHFYRVDASGAVEEVSLDMCTPFAVVSHFHPTLQFNIGNTVNIDSLALEIDRHLPTPDIFYMIRIEAELSYIHYRSVFPQTKPYRPLQETLSKVQQEFELDHTYVTLIGLKSPTSCTPHNVPGYHFHFLDKERKTGGHVFDLALINSVVYVQLLPSWKIHFIRK